MKKVQKWRELKGIITITADRRKKGEGTKALSNIIRKPNSIMF